MKLQIERLIVWSKHDKSKRNEIVFKTECVNVLSGESRTGKSAISSIIDYCLGSKNCDVPIGRVRENVSWYGLLIDTDRGRYLIARENPEGNNNTSAHCYLKNVNNDDEIPLEYPTTNTSREQIVEILADIAGVTDIERGEKGPENTRLSFRDLTHLLFQVQDIVANRYMLFYKMQRSEVMSKVAEWFNFIIGAETTNDVFLRQKLEELQRDYLLLTQELNRLSEKLKTFIPKLRGNLISALELGLWSTDEALPTDEQKLLSITESICNNDGAILNKQPSTQQISKELAKIKAENEELATKLMSVNKSLAQVEDLNASVDSQKNATGMIKERLSISGWLLANAQLDSSGVCPVCGERGHNEAHTELQKIAAYVKKCEKAMEQVEQYSSTSLKEMLRLQAEKKELQKRFATNEKQIEELFNLKKSEDLRYLERQKNISMVLANLKMILELNKSLSDESTLKKQKDLKSEIEKIKASFNEETIKQKEDRYIKEICSIALKRLKSLDCENQYKIHPPIFKKKDMNIWVCDETSKPHPLGEVGSASNWVALHVAFTCALQEFFAAQKTPKSCVPNFMVYDQPSQVYFPSGKRDQKDPHAIAEEIKETPLKEDDKTAVRKIFSTINDSIQETKITTGTGWQAIILEHADKDIYGDITEINIIEPWRNGKALIPHDWYEERN